MVEIIMTIGILFFFIGFFFEKAMKIAVNEWREVERSLNSERRRESTSHIRQNK